MEKRVAHLEARVQLFEEKLDRLRTYAGEVRNEISLVESNSSINGVYAEPKQELDLSRSNARQSRQFVINSDQSDVDLADLLHSATELRKKHFDEDLFFDPVWLMLLDLFVAEAKGTQISVSSLCLASGVADTTALRYLNLMQERGLVERIPDTWDRRRCFVVLAEKSRLALRGYLSEMRSILHRGI